MSKPTPLHPLTPAQKGKILARARAWKEPNHQLMIRVWRVLGHARAQALVIDTQNLVATGGMLTADGSRQRTIGGIFFTLCKDRATSRERGRIFRPAPAPQDSPDPEILSTIVDKPSSPASVEIPTVPIINDALVVATVAPEVGAPAPAAPPAPAPRRPPRKVVTQKTPGPISERLLAQLEHKGWVVRDQQKTQRSTPV